MSKKTFYIPLDLETGGFNGPMYVGDTLVQGAGHYPILEVAAKMLDSDLNELTYLIDAHIQPDRESLDKMDPDTWKFHQETGFAQTWLKSDRRIPLKDAEKIIYKGILKTLIEAGVLPEDAKAVPNYRYENNFELIPLGKSLAYFDRAFINHQMPELAMILSHQTADISAVRVLMKGVKNWPRMVSKTAVTHNAMDDVDVAINDARVLRELIKPTLTEKCKTVEALVEQTRPFDTEMIIELKGEYCPGKSYRRGSVVTCEGKTYIAMSNLPAGFPMIVGTGEGNWRDIDSYPQCEHIDQIKHRVHREEPVTK